MGQKEYPRQNRVNEQIRRVLAESIRQLGDPRLGLATVTDVEVSRDYSYAKVFVSILNADKAADSMHALKHAAGFLRRELAHATAMRTTPRLQFIRDDSLERAEKMDHLIDRGLPHND